MSNTYDALIIGGGPGGSVSALLLARAGLRVCLIEKSRHPRFHIGESILPRNLPLMQELGLEPELRRLPHLPKYGAEFGIGNDPNTMKFEFSDGLVTGSPTFNIERAGFDKMLLDAARSTGAEILEDTAVKKINRLEDGAVELATADRDFSGRILLDASGHGAVVGRHLGTRRGFDDPHLQKVAYFQHFENVERLPGKATGHPTIIMCREGWFWLIGLTDTKTSVGFVTRPAFVKEINVPPDRLLQWAIARCPVVRHRMRNAVGSPMNEVLSDFSYTCKPYAGPGYFLVGDAGCFLDPIFSTGVTLAMMGAREAARHAIAILQKREQPAVAQKAYCKFVEGSTGIFWGLIRNYYRHSFRELFMNGRGPLQVHNAVISILAGNVFPKPVWALRWRLRFFNLCMRLQQYLPLCPRRPECSLLSESPVPIPATGSTTGSAVAV
jgi:flavin-dependent dehydrogenase